MSAADPAPVRPTAFGRLGRFTVRHRWSVLVTYVVSLVVMGGIGFSVFGALQGGGFQDPGSDSSRASAILEERFGAKDPLVVLAVESPGGIDDPSTTAAATDLVQALSTVDGVQFVVSYWTSGQPEQLRGSDGRTGQVILYADPDADRSDLSSAIEDDFSGQQGELTVYVFGGGPINNAFNQSITKDLARAESIAIPITVVLLLFVFGSVVAAGLPFLVAASAILGSFLVLYLTTFVTDVSIFAVNLVTGLGLGLGIDYALLMITRFREELKGGRSVEDSVAATMATAGKTVFVSGLTVAITLASLAFFPQFFLKSFAYAGVSVSLLAVLGALTALPALLALLGRNVNRLKVRRGDLAPRDDGLWSRLARFSMRRPWPVMLGSIAVLLVMAAPAFSAVFGQVDDRALRSDHPVAVAGEVLRERFPGQESSPYDVVLLGAGDSAQVEQYAVALSGLDGVVRVATPESIVVDGSVRAPNTEPATWSSGSDIRLVVTGDVPPIDPQGEALVEAIRAQPAPADEALVGGIAAVFADSTAGIVDNAWVIALWIGVTTLIILFLYTGSVLIPIKAVVLNLLSLSATLGLLVWTFQGGHLGWITGDYTPTGTIDISTVALIAIVAFALSMDYELFLLSRIKEEHDAGRSTADAVAFGLQRTGRIITAAAVLIAVVFASFLSSGVTNIKQLGFGVTVAILVDATVVRGLLVPAFMRIAGRANWWAPAWLRRLHGRFGLSDA